MIVLREKEGWGGRVTKVDKELEDLKPCDPLLPPDPDAARALKVVPIHEDVDRQVEGYGHPGNRRLPTQLGVAEQDRCAVMVAVEKCCCPTSQKERDAYAKSRRAAPTHRFLLENKKDGVDQFEVLGQVVDLTSSVSGFVMMQGVVSRAARWKRT